MKFEEKIKEIRDGLETIFNASKTKKKANRQRFFWALSMFFIILIVLILVAMPILAYELLYQNKIYVGVSIDGINVGGLAKEEAIVKLNQYIDNLNSRGLNFQFDNQKINVQMTVVSPVDPDLAYQLLAFDAEQMVQQAYSYGRDKNVLDNMLGQLRAILNQEKVELKYVLNEPELKNILVSRFKTMENPGSEAQIVFSGNDWSILPEKQGFSINYDQAISDLKQNLNLVSFNTINLKTEVSMPTVTKAEAEQNKNLISEVLGREKMVLIYGEKKWEITKDEFKNWLGFSEKDGQVILVFKPELLKVKLEATAKEINIPPQDAKFVMTDSKVTEFSPGINGQELDIENSLSQISQDFIQAKQDAINLLVKESEPSFKTADSNNLGIKELIGKGVSDFSGSHTNRIKNIKNAVNHLNGIIIPSGEFSIVEAIGEVNAATGYFQEYVIKGDRTIPEYGGGLCQIGTTVFRAALYSGLPITERRPHSYIVSYYKPLGMDATIYGPHPDLRFNNDTGNNILLQIKIEGTILTFEFWGTSDGRKVEITDPELYNWTGVPADKLIENPKLKPGQKKLLETGRRGADAHFYRYITLPNGEKKEEIIRSHYVAWPNIYEIGVEKAPENPAPATDPSTDTPVLEPPVIEASPAPTNINS